MRGIHMSILFLLASALVLGGCAEEDPEPEQASPEPDITLPEQPSIDVHEAAAEGDFETVQEYIDGGGDVNAPGLLGSTPLHFAARAGHPEVAGLLLEAGAQVNVRSDPGVTPLHAAAHGNHAALADLLIQYGAEIDAHDKNHGYTPLHRAAVYGHVEVSRVLLKNGADYHAQDSSEETPIDIARRREAEELVRVLEDHIASSPAAQ